jgi:hypothetical protein
MPVHASHANVQTCLHNVIAPEFPESTADGLVFLLGSPIRRAMRHLGARVQLVEATSLVLVVGQVVTQPAPPLFEGTFVLALEQLVEESAPGSAVSSQQSAVSSQQSAVSSDDQSTHHVLAERTACCSRLSEARSGDPALAMLT